MKQYLIRALSGLLGMSGLAILGFILFTFARSQAYANQQYPDLISPLVGGEYGLKSTRSTVLATSDVNSEGVDYTDATNWFPDASSNTHFATGDEISFYTLSVPELGIHSASVAIGGEDLSDSLIQYPGTALPGKKGNAVVFGHSILPVFYNPENYLSIFSKIDTLKKGSKIIVNYDGVTYTYKVQQMFRVKPTDVYILDQNDDGYFLSLVTCFPMGDPRKPERLVVRAELSL